MNKKYKLNTTIGDFIKGSIVSEKEISKLLNVNICVDCGWLIEVLEPKIEVKDFTCAEQFVFGNTPILDKPSNYILTLSSLIPLDKYRVITEAVEKVLNTDTTTLGGINEYIGVDKEVKKEQIYFLTNDEVYYTYGEKKQIFCLNTKSNRWVIDRHPEMYEQLMEVYDKFFYLEDKAKEYVNLHCPKLSASDVFAVLNKYENLNAKVMFPTFEKDILEIVKSKLNQQ